MNKGFALITIGMVLATGVASIPLAATVEDKTNEVLQILEKVVNGSFDTLDRGWEIALKFKDPNYVYDPKELGDPPQSMREAFKNTTITEEDIINSPG